MLVSLAKQGGMVRPREGFGPKSVSEGLRVAILGSFKQR